MASNRCKVQVSVKDFAEVRGHLTRLASLEAFAEAVRVIRDEQFACTLPIGVRSYVVQRLDAALAKLDAAKKEGE